MNIKVYLVADKIEKFYLEAIKEYEKRLSRYCKIQLIQVKNKNQLLKISQSKSYKILVSPKGQQISSEELADKINSLAISGKSDIAFIIAAEKVPHEEVLSISPMEMDLGLKATILFEQIYRSYRIINNEPYHKWLWFFI